MASALLASLKTQEVVNSLRHCSQSEGIAADTAFTKSLLAESTSRTTADAAFTKELKPLKPFATFDTNSFFFG